MGRNAFYKVQWRTDRKSQIRQLTNRVVPLALAAMLAAAAFLAVGSSVVRSRLNRSVVESIASRSLQVADGYLLPYFRFLDSALLWMRVGSISSLGNPEEYAEALYHNLELMGEVAALSLLDPDNRELAIVREDEGFRWFETTVGAPDSLVNTREAAGVRYLNLANEPSADSQTDIPQRLRVSTPYMLQGQDELGITLATDIGGSESPYGMSIWIDLPLEPMAQWLESLEGIDNSAMFLLLPGGDFLLFSVNDVIDIARDRVETPIGSSLPAADSQLLDGAIAAINAESSDRFTDISFDYDGRTWRADSRSLSLENEDVLIGTIIPEDGTWIADLFFPARMAGVSVFVIVTLLIVLLVWDFRRNTNVQTEAERLRAMVDMGESERLEFKSSMRWDYRQDKPNKELEIVILKSIAAFSNHRGGTLLIGIGDDGTALGLGPDYGCLRDPGSDYFELHLRNLISAHYGISFAAKNVRVRFQRLDKTEICRVEVRKGRYPLYTKVAAKGSQAVEKFFLRSGNSSRAVDDMSEAAAYIIRRFGRRATRHA